MMATGALLCVSIKHRLTLMASSSDSLHDRLPDQVLTAGTGRDGERWVGWSSCFPCFLRSCSCLSLSPYFLLLGSLRDRVTRTLGAAWVLAVAAKLVRTKGGLAAVAVTTNSHPDRLLYSLGSPVGARVRHPFLGFKSQPILGEQSTSLLLLRVTPVTHRGGLRSLPSHHGRVLSRLLGAIADRTNNVSSPTTVNPPSTPMARGLCLSLYIPRRFAWLTSHLAHGCNRVPV